MKTKILLLAIISFWSLSSVFAQDRTTVTANNSDVSDNLDLRAVASIFVDSRDLPDFERRLNDPNSQISNLDLNGDNTVDYLRVIETVEGNTHLIIIQSVLGHDNYQDIATVEVERDRYNKVQVQVVGDVYMYGNNYIYEPIYAYPPVIYTSFWVGNYRPYYSSWYWGYYPSFYIAWSPFPVYSYHNHIGIYINFNHQYNYVDYRRCAVAYNNYYNGKRGNYYERQYPTRSFSNRNTGYANRYELDNNRRIQNTSSRNQVATNGTRNNSNTVGSSRSVATQNGSRSESSPRSNENQRAQESQRSLTTSNNQRSDSSPRSNQNQRAQESQRIATTSNNQRSDSSPRSNENQSVQESRRNSSPREFSQQRGNSQRSEGNSRGNRRI